MPVEHNDNVSEVLAATADARPRVDPSVLRSFLEELFRWNTQLGLVSKRDTPAVVVRLISRSVRMWDFVRDSLADEQLARVHRVVDIGSGGGFPGLIWKMLSPDREFLLVERKERKVAFLERVIARTRMAGIRAVAADLREVARWEAQRHANDLAVMMAVADPAEFAGPVEEILIARGYFCARRGRDEPRPPEHLGRRLRMLAQRDVEDGRLLIYETLPSDGLLS